MNKPNETNGTSDESIGRPDEWREGRYQQPDKPVDRSVRAPSRHQDDSRDPVSTPVTQRDYEQLTPP
jgi:hypothetical protein